MDAPNRLLADPEEGVLDGAETALLRGDDHPAPNDPDSPDDQTEVSPGNPTDGAQSATGAGGLDRRQAAEAYKKVLAGQELTVREHSILKRFEKEKEERLRWQYYASIPQRHWRDMSGRQTKVINEQAARYGLPFGGATISLPKVVRSLHEFLADNAQKLAREDDELMQGSSSPALERYREERALIARLDRLEREARLVPRDEVRDALGRIASILRGAGDTLQRQFGPAAAEILLEALDDASREIDRSFQPPEEDGDQPVLPASSSSAG